MYTKRVMKLNTSDASRAVVITTEDEDETHQLDLWYTTNPRARTRGFGEEDPHTGITTWCIHLTKANSDLVKLFGVEVEFTLVWGPDKVEVTTAIPSGNA